MKFRVNNSEIEVSEDKLETSLLEFLREELNLTGAKNGCGIGICGACTVLINNVAMRACRKKVKDVIAKEVLTIEGLQKEDGTLHPLQQAFIDCGAIQCGFCTPGMVLAAHALLLKNPNPDREEIRKGLRGNLCRCTGYQQIVDAIQSAAKYYQ